MTENTIVCKAKLHLAVACDWSDERAFVVRTAGRAGNCWTSVLSGLKKKFCQGSDNAMPMPQKNSHVAVKYSPMIYLRFLDKVGTVVTWQILSTGAPRQLPPRVALGRKLSLPPKPVEWYL